uniref:Hypothetical secreted peptide n=1 Tax=Glossina morsitans morsitans TaxID=37546 RepID=D3TSL6_GLOMM
MYNSYFTFLLMWLLRYSSIFSIYLIVNKNICIYIKSFITKNENILTNFKNQAFLKIYLK